ncbi:hypothetical protein PROFUN_06117 [Planoprotostelium fungivorum]|uniref:Uncharacterized protein n=1 Tax=Planoprotostelium fungivorum TaxID=1890364 RepID=A0A2P6NPG2_9EUKA|nr:hypothetical protein PROFUN_06117 [Planoprotostelium fungivorum]
MVKKETTTNNAATNSNVRLQREICKFSCSTAVLISHAKLPRNACKEKSLGEANPHNSQQKEKSLVAFFILCLTVAQSTDVWITNTYANKDCTGDINMIKAEVISSGCQTVTSVGPDGKETTTSTQTTYSSASRIYKTYTSSDCSGDATTKEMKSGCDGMEVEQYLSTNQTWARAPTADASVSLQYFGADCKSSPATTTIRFNFPCNKESKGFGTCNNIPTQIVPKISLASFCGDKAVFPSSNYGSGAGHATVMMALMGFLLVLTI